MRTNGKGAYFLVIAHLLTSSAPAYSQSTVNSLFSKPKKSDDSIDLNYYQGENSRYPVWVAEPSSSFSSWEHASLETNTPLVDLLRFNGATVDSPLPAAHIWVHQEKTIGESEPLDLSLEQELPSLDIIETDHSDDESDDVSDDIATEVSQAGSIVASEGVKGYVDSLENRLKGYGDQKLGEAVIDTLSPYGTTEFSTNWLSSYDSPSLTFNMLVPLWDDSKHITFTQWGYQYNNTGSFSDRDFLNIGLGYRFGNESSMWGANAFYDVDLTRSHRRGSIGGEYFEDFLKLSGNYYFPLSSWKDSKDFDHYLERPAHGFDLEATGYFPSYPQLGASITYEHYFGDEVDILGSLEKQENPYAFSVDGTYTPIPILTLSSGVKKAKGQSSSIKFGIDLTYRFGIPWSKQWDPDMVEQAQGLSWRKYDLVKRNNNIILEYKEKDSFSVAMSDVNVQSLNAGDNYKPLKLSVSINSRAVSNKGYDVKWSLPSQFIRTVQTVTAQLSNANEAKLVSALSKQPSNESKTIEVLVPPFEGQYLYSVVVTDKATGVSKTARGHINVDSSILKTLKRTASVNVDLSKNKTQFALAFASSTPIELKKAWENYRDASYKKDAMPMKASLMWKKKVLSVIAKLNDKGTVLSLQVNDTDKKATLFDYLGKMDGLLLEKFTVGKESIVFPIEVKNYIGSAVDISTYNSLVTTTGAKSNGVESNTATITLKDAQNHPISGEVVAIESTGSAKVSEVKDNNNGTYTASITNIKAEQVTITAIHKGKKKEATMSFFGYRAPTVENVVIETSSPLPKAGDKLIGSYTFIDLDGDKEGESKYQWLANNTPISGATNKEYVVESSQLGKSISFTVTPVSLSKFESTGNTVSSKAIKVGKPTGNAIKPHEKVTGKVGDKEWTAIVTGSPNGVVTYSSSDTAKVKVDSSTGKLELLLPTSDAPVIITATDSGDEKFAPQSVTTEVVVTKADPTAFGGKALIAVPEITAKVGDEDVSAKTEGGNGKLLYSVSPASVASIDPVTGKLTLTGVGKATVTVVDPGDERRSGQTVSTVVNVGKADGDKAGGKAIIPGTDSAIETKVGDKDASAAASGGNGKLTYSVSPASVATIDPKTGKLTIVGPGKALVTITDEGDDKHNPQSITKEIIASKGDSNAITAHADVTGQVGDSGLSAAVSGKPNGSVTYSSNEPSKVGVNPDGSLVLLSSTENTPVIVTATDSGNEKYSPQSVTTKVTVTKADGDKAGGVALVPAADITASVGDVGVSAMATGGNGILVYSVSPANIATINSRTGLLTLIGVGTATVTVTDAGGTNHLVQTKHTKVTVNLAKGDAAGGIKLVPASAITAQVGDAGVTAKATGGNNALSYSVTPTTVATINANTGELTLVGVGDAVVSVTDNGSAIHSPQSATTQITVNKADGDKAGGIKLVPAAEFTAQVGDENVTAKATGGNGALSYSVRPAGIATIDPVTGALTLIAPSNILVTVSDEGTAIHEQQTATTLIRVLKADGDKAGGTKLVPVSNELTGKVGDRGLRAAVVGGNSKITYSVTPNDVATIDEDTGELNLVGPGKAIVTARDMGSPRHNRQNVTIEVTVNKADGDKAGGIALVAAPAITAKIGDSGVSAKATGGNGALSYTVSPTTIATVDSNTGALTLTGVGTAIVTVSDQGDAIHNPQSATTEVTVTKADGATLVPTSNEITGKVGDVGVKAEVSGGSGKLTYSVGPESVAKIDPATGALTLVGPGKATITVSDSGTANHNPQSVTIGLTVTKADGDKAGGIALVPASDVTAKVGDSGVSAKASGGNGSITYSVSPQSVATIDANTGALTLISVGKATVTATDSGTANHNPQSVTTVITVTKTDGDKAGGIALVAASAINAKVGDNGVSAKATGGNGSITYSVSPQSVATIDANTGVLTLISVGKATVTATDSGSAKHNPQSVTTEVTVTKADGDKAGGTALVAASAITAKVGDSNVSAKASGGNGAVTYSVSPQSVATIDVSTGALTLVSVGKATVTATDSGSAKHNPQSVTTEVTVIKADGDKAGGVALVPASAITASISSSGVAAKATGGNGAITYSVSPQSVATIDENTGALTLVSVGKATVTATDSGTANHNPQSVTTEVTVIKANGIALVPASAITAKVGDSGITARATGGNGTVTYTVSPLSVATIDANTGALTLVGVGKATVTAADSGTDKHNPQSVTTEVTVTKADGDKAGGIALVPASAITAKVGDSNISAKATGGNGSITYSVSPRNVAAIDANTGTLTLISVGKATVTATDSGSAKHNPQSVTTEVTVTKADGNKAGGIPLVPAAAITASVGDDGITARASGGNGSVTYSVTPQSVATIDENTGALTLVSVGKATVTAADTGTANHNSQSVTTEVTVTKADGDKAGGIALVPASAITAKVGDSNVTAKATGGNGSITYSVSPQNVATVDTNTGALTLVSVGKATVTATDAGTANHNPQSVTTEITVTKTDGDKAGGIALIPASEITASVGTSGVTAKATGGNGAITYSVSPDNIATIDANTGALALISVGTATVTATDSGSAKHNPQSATTKITVVKADGDKAGGVALVPASALTAQVGDQNVTAKATGGNGSITYSVSPESVAIIDANTGALTLISVGKATVTATDSGTANHNPQSVTTEVTVTKADGDKAGGITLVPAAGLTAQVGDADVSAAATGGNGSVTYSITPESVATVSSTGVLTLLSVGKATVTATDSGSAKHNPQSVTTEVTVIKADGDKAGGVALVPASAMTVKINDTGITAKATGGNGKLAYSVIPSTIATIDANTGELTLVSVGKAIVTVTDEGTAKHNSQSATTEVTVTKADGSGAGGQPLVAAPEIVAKVGDQGVSAAASGGNGELTYTINLTNVATVDAKTGLLTLLSTGTAIVTVTDKGDANNHPQSGVTKITVNKAVGSAITAHPNVSGKVGDAGLNAVVSGTPKGTVSYSSSDPSKVVVHSSTGALTLVSPTSGTPVIITATDSGDNNHTPQSVTTEVTVTKADGDKAGGIALVPAAAITARYGDTGITAKASGGNGALTYSVSPQSIATIDANTGALTLVSVGKAVVTVTDSGSATHNVQSATTEVTVNKAAGDTAGGSKLIPVGDSITGKVGDPDIDASAKGGNGKLTYTVTPPNVATIDKDTGKLKLVGPGRATVTVTDEGDDKHDPQTVTTEVTVVKGDGEAAGGKKLVPAADITMTFGSSGIKATATGGNGALTYSINPTSVATINASTGEITSVSVGVATVSVTDEGNANNNPQIVTTQVTINKANGNAITAHPNVSGKVGDAGLTAVVSGTPRGTVTYSSSDITKVVVNSSTGALELLLPTSGSAVTITATDSGDANHGAQSVTTEVTVAKADGDKAGGVVLVAASAITAKVGDSGVSAEASGGNGSITYSVTPESVATIDANTGALTLVGAGKATVTATDSGTVKHSTQTVTTEVTVTKADGDKAGGVKLVPAPALTAKVGDTGVLAKATGGNGAVTYSVSPQSVATIDASTGALTLISVGKATVTATDSGSAKHNTQSVTTEVTVIKADGDKAGGVALIPASAITASVGDNGVTAKASGGNGAITYSVSPQNIATIDANTGALTLVGVGKATVTATDSGSAKHNPQSVTTEVTVTKADGLALVPANAITASVGDSDVSAKATGGNGTITYSVTPLSVATIDANTGALTLISVGKATVTANDAGDENHNAQSVTTEVTVTKADGDKAGGVALVPASAVTAKVGDAGVSAKATGGNGAVTYSVSPQSVATIDSNTGELTMISVGKATVTATDSGTAKHNTQSVTTEVTVTKADGDKAGGVALVPATAITASVGDAGVSAKATGGNGAVTYSVSPLSVATIDANTGALTLISVGKATVTATDSGSAKHNTQSVTTEVTVTKADGDKAGGVALVPAAAITAKVGDSNVSAKATGGNGAITYSVSPQSVATIDANTGALTLISVGKATVTATDSGSAKHNPQSVTTEVTVTKADGDKAGGIALVPASAITAKVDDAGISAKATGGNGAVTYSVSPQSVATIDENTGALTLVSVGKAIVTATDSGSAKHNPQSVTTEVTVSKADGDKAGGIALVPAANVTAQIGDSGVTAKATGGNGAIAYSINPESVATVDANTGVLTLLSVGKATVTATDSGSAKHNPQSVITEVTVTKADGDKAGGIALVPAPDITAKVNDADVNATATGGNGTLTYSVSPTSVATINSGTGELTLVGVGTATVTVSDTGSSKYLPQTKQTKLIVNKAVGNAISAHANVNGQVGDAGLTAVVSGTPNGTVTYSSSDITKVTVDASTGALTLLLPTSGTPVVITATDSGDDKNSPQSVSTEVTVTKAEGNAAGGVLLVPAPAITSKASETGVTAKATGGNGALTYSVAPTSVATVNANTGELTFVSLGKATVTVKDSGSAKHKQQSVTTEVTVIKGDGNALGGKLLVPASDINAKFGDTGLSAKATGGNGTLTYSVTPTSVATINSANGDLSIVGAGSAIVTVVDSGDVNNNPQSVTTNVTVSKASGAALVPAEDITAKIGDPDVSAAASGGNGTLTYSVVSTEVATVDSATGALTLVGVGRTEVLVHDDGGSNFVEQSARTVITVTKAEGGGAGGQILVPAKDITAKVGQSGVAARATGGNGTLTYSVTPSSVATINSSNGLLNLVGAGTATVTVTDEGNEANLPQSKQTTVYVNKTAGNLAGGVELVPAKEIFAEVGEQGITAKATGGNGTLTYSVTPETVATVDSATGALTLLNVGTAVVTVIDQGTDKHLRQSRLTTVNVAGVGGLTLVPSPAVTGRVGEVGLSAPATGGRGKVLYSIDPEWVATIDSDTGALTPLRVGRAKVTAVDQGNSQNAQQVVFTQVTISNGTESELIPAPAINAKYGDTGLTAEAQGGDGVVSYTVSPAGVVSIDQETGELTIVGAGSARVKVFASGDHDNLSQTKYTDVTITKADGDKAGGVALVPATDFTVKLDQSTASAKATGGNGALTYSVTPANVATINSTTGELTLVGEGVATVTVTDSESTTHLVQTKQTTVTVEKAPGVAITAHSSLSVQYKDTGYNVAVSGTPNGTVTYSSSDTSKVAVNSSTGALDLLFPTGSTPVTITATDSGNEIYSPQSVVTTVSVAKADGHRKGGIPLVFDSKYFNRSGTTAILNATGGNGTIIYSSGNPNIARIDKRDGDDIIRLDVAGTTLITATDPGTETHAPQTKTAYVRVYAPGDFLIVFRDPYREISYYDQNTRMNWYNAKNACESQDLRLPTLAELAKLRERHHDDVVAKGWTSRLEGSYNYWTSDPGPSGWAYTNRVNDITGNLEQAYKSGDLRSVACVAQTE